VICGPSYTTTWDSPGHEEETARITARRRRAFALVDQTVAQYDPLSQWPQFREALWDGRHPLMKPPAKG
jgi:hypothetical protein